MSFEIKLKYKYNENPLLYATDFIFTENYISSPQIPCHHTLSLSISLPFFLFRYFYLFIYNPLRIFPVYCMYIIVDTKPLLYT